MSGWGHPVVLSPAQHPEETCLSLSHRAGERERQGEILSLTGAGQRETGRDTLTLSPSQGWSRERERQGESLSLTGAGGERETDPQASRRVNLLYCVISTCQTY